jgi:C-terminal processing protease CtpA/Prc
LSASPQQAAEKDLEHSRSYGIKMLKVVKEQIEKNYYDPRFHGLDLDARFKRAEEQIKQATSDGQVIGVIAQAVLDLNDSHTRLVPPLRKVVAVYGWRMQMIGDICYVTAVKPGSDAELKGLKAGDRILALDGIEPTREILWKMKYLYYSLRPKSRIQITFQAPESQVRTVEVLPKLEQRRIEAEFGRIVDVEPISPELGSIPPRRPQYQEFGADLIVYVFPSFNTQLEAIDKMMQTISGHKSLILDLRGNSGGRTDIADRLISYFFDYEVKVGDFKFRHDVKTLKIKPRKGKIFTGDLLVLVDSQSSSASEIFARLVQLEKRGIVVGDRSAGHVMQSRRYGYMLKESGDLILYGLSITDADIVMTDGKSLEWVGLVPDKVVLPTSDDIRNQRDPALAYAASLVGIKLDAEKAGALFGAKP